VIVCVATNASVDKLFEVNRLVPGAIHRPRSFVQVPGGKGLNVARAAAGLGADVTAVTLLAGAMGRWVEAALDGEGVRGRFAWARTGETRAALSVADHERGSLTEFYEDGAPIDDGDWEALMGAAREAMRGADWVTVSGSLPPGAPGDGHARLVRAARESGARVALDSRGDALDAGLAGGPDLVKVNGAEAAEVLDRAVADTTSALEAAGMLAARAGAGSAAAVTLGADGAVLLAPDGSGWIGHCDARGPYPVGSGDAFLAGLVVALAGGKTWPDALGRALGAAAANAEEPGAGRLRKDRADALTGIATVSRAP
jgi:1-phosphofructokinase family hexose kinase